MGNSLNCKWLKFSISVFDSRKKYLEVPPKKQLIKKLCELWENRRMVKHAPYSCELTEGHYPSIATPRPQENEQSTIKTDNIYIYLCVCHGVCPPANFKLTVEI